MRLGLLIPCYNESAVIRRRLLNLRACAWPEEGPHRIVVVDDHSQDGTAQIAEEALRELFKGEGAIRSEVIRSRASTPGKPGALRAGMEALGDSVDLIVMTDADVLFEEEALRFTALAFENRPHLAMATGAQRFVAELSSDGRTSSEPAGRADPLDRFSSFVRSIEASYGRTFSVHGPLLAWRRELELQPQDGIAADDLDLMLQVRTRFPISTARIERLSNAVFHERKTPPGAQADEQALRRARAWFQVFRGRPAPRQADDLFRAQYHLYAKGPAWAPLLALVSAVLFPIQFYPLFGLRGVGVALALLFVLLLTPYGRFALRTLRVIDRARRLEAEAPLPARWEPAR